MPFGTAFRENVLNNHSRVFISCLHLPPPHSCTETQCSYRNSSFQQKVPRAKCFNPSPGNPLLERLFEQSTIPSKNKTRDWHWKLSLKSFKLPQEQQIRSLKTTFLRYNRYIFLNKKEKCHASFLWANIPFPKLVSWVPELKFPSICFVFK